MKTARLSLFILLFMTASMYGSGQITRYPWQGITSRSNIQGEKLSGKKYYLKFNTNGPHFYHYEFLPTTIFLENGETRENIPARYNALLNELVCYNTHTGSLFTIDKFMVREFVVSSQITGDQKFVKIETGIPHMGTQFFHVLYQGEVTLLAFYQSKSKKTGIYKDPQGILKDSRLVLTTAFYRYSVESGLEKFPPIRKSFLHLYKNNKKQVRKILRKNRLYTLDIPELVLAFRLIENAGITP
jgi:hypothetical protein